MEAQLGLFEPRTRWEIPLAESSSIEDGAIVRVRIGVHSIDTSWPWWKPGLQRVYWIQEDGKTADDGRR